MTDFYDRLEDQLIAAGRRRQAQGRVGRAVAGRERTLFAMAATVVALAVALAIALPAMMTNDSTSEPVAPPPPPPPAAVEQRPARDSRLAGIRIAVYNATLQPDAGHDLGEELRSHGARVFVFGNVLVQAGDRTVIRYQRGAEAQARRVATVLGVARIDPYEFPEAEGNPPPTARAAVIVLVGDDQQ